VSLILTDLPLDLARIEQRIEDAGFGATVTFCGYVRNNNLGKQIVSLEYEVFPPMAEEQFAKIEAEIKDKWPGTAIETVHRIGLLQVGELSVVIAVGAAHRKEAFAACAYAIDKLKERVPIWKIETDTAGKVWRDGDDDKCEPEG
jgi:molybdopterin synthase catalytic subunit